jgi:hypothetical protein
MDQRAREYLHEGRAVSRGRAKRVLERRLKFQELGKASILWNYVKPVGRNGKAIASWSGRVRPHVAGSRVMKDVYGPQRGHAVFGFLQGMTVTE